MSPSSLTPEQYDQANEIIDRAKAACTEAGLNIGSEARFPFTYHHDLFRTRYNIDDRGTAAKWLTEWATRRGEEGDGRAYGYAATLGAIEYLLTTHENTTLQDYIHDKDTPVTAFIEEATRYLISGHTFDSFVRQKMAMREEFEKTSDAECFQITDQVLDAGGFLIKVERYGRGNHGFYIGLPQDDGTWTVTNGSPLKACLAAQHDDDIRCEFGLGCRTDMSLEEATEYCDSWMSKMDEIPEFWVAYPSGPSFKR
jgi:hypothetical protein